jgi:hypothetical protein
VYASQSITLSSDMREMIRLMSKEMRIRDTEQLVSYSDCYSWSDSMVRSESGVETCTFQLDLSNLQQLTAHEARALEVFTALYNESLTCHRRESYPHFSTSLNSHFLFDIPIPTYP